MRIIPSFLIFLLGFSGWIHARTSVLWEDFVEAKQEGRIPVLADFSYSGYHAGDKEIPHPDWPVFCITEFGGIPDDGKSDRDAFLAAIEAAEKSGSGIIRFPPGRFRINEEMDPHNEPIVIRSSRIILRGAGSHAGGTEIFIARHMDPADPRKLWTCPYVIQFEGKDRDGPAIRVAGPVRRSSFSVEVSDGAAFAEGDWVELRYLDNSPQAIDEALQGYQPDPRWTGILEQGVEVNEYHLVVRVEKNRLTFREPIHATVSAADGWTVRKISALEEVGVEGISFTGNWKEAFVHHKNAIHDGGWSVLRIVSCVNGWVRDCRFTDVNRCIALVNSAAITLEDIQMEGNPGHNAISLIQASHCLVQRITDHARHWHASGVAKPSSGNVFLRSEYNPDTCFESHASQPRWTLFDNISGGWKYGRWGGALHLQPNHLEGLVFWNYRNTGAGEEGRFHFMRPESDSEYGRIVRPFVIGFHGTPQEWVESEIRFLESNGQPVHPESLYEAQLEYRRSQEKEVR